MWRLRLVVVLNAHYLPRDAEIAGNAIAKLNRYKTTRGDQKESENARLSKRPAAGLRSSSGRFWCGRAER